MKFFRIRAELLSPLVVRKNRMSSSPQGADWLPGSSLRGAMAAKFLRETGTPDHEAFRLLFAVNPVRFPNLLPTDEEGTSPSLVLPLTSVSCKRHPGFKTSAENAHGVSDSLAAKLAERTFPGTFQRRPCAVCQNDKKPYSGFWNGSPENPAEFKPSMFFQRHTGIDRSTGTIAAKIFFATQAMADYRLKSFREQRNASATRERDRVRLEQNENSDAERFCKQYLAGEISLTVKQYEALAPLLEGTLFAGAECTRGKGELSVDLVSDSEPSAPDVETWNDGFKGKLETLVPEDVAPERKRSLLEGRYFSIGLASDAILVDRFLRPASDIHLDFPHVEYVMKVARHKTVRGWNAAWGLPKHDDSAVAMGSVYLFKHLGKESDALVEYLRDLTAKGIGLRKEEGFGKISICDPFHIVREEI